MSATEMPTPVDSSVNSDASSDCSLGDSTVASKASTRMPDATAMHQDGKIKIVCVGLMRTGLKTLRRALEKLGYSDFYDQENIVDTFEGWDALLRNKAPEDPFPSIFQEAQVVMGMPTYCFWEQIAARYPNARIILTVRDEDEWWASVKRAKALMDDELPGAPLKYGSTMRRLERFLVPSYHKFCDILRFSWASTLGANALESDELNEVAARNSYRRHNAHVTSTLRKRQTASGHKQLLVYDVRDGWEPLCKFLKEDVPEDAFPSVMNVPYFVPDKEGEESDSGEKKSADCSQEVEELLVADSEFGIKMRHELRRGLTIAGAALAIPVGTAVAVHMTSVFQVPLAVVSLIYLALIATGWQAYVVMHSLVMRVPALVVLPMAMKSVLIALCLQGCFITYGILKEMIVTQDHIASPVLILSARLMSVICGAIALLLTDGKISFGGAPLYAFSAFGFTNEASTWAGYEMLKYVSFPVQVMAKSCKLLPNMIMGKMLNGTKYEWSQYAQAIGAMVCVTIMHLSDEGDHKKGKKSKGPATDAEESEYMRMCFGISLLIMFFACDSFTSQWQTALYKKYQSISQTQMMLAGNLVGTLITMGSIITRWTKVSESLAYAIANPEVMGRILLLGLSGAMGQFCIYTAIKVLGPLAFTWIMTSRQLFSVLISLVMFGHGVSPVKLMCILTVFAIMSSKQLSKAMPHVVKKCKSIKERTITSKSEQAAAKGPRRVLEARGSQVWDAPILASDDKKTD